MLILKSMLSRLQKVGTTKAKGVGQVLVFGIAFITLMIIVISYSLRAASIRYDERVIDTALTTSLLAAATIDLHEYATNGSLLVNNKSGYSTTGFVGVNNPADGKINGVAREGGINGKAYKDFTRCIKNNLGLANDFSFEGSKGLYVSGKLRIVEFELYDVYYDATNTRHIIRRVINPVNGSCSATDVGSSYLRSTTDGNIVITEASVYAKIGFMFTTSVNFAGATKDTDEYFISRVVSIISVD